MNAAALMSSGLPKPSRSNSILKGKDYESDEK